MTAKHTPGPWEYFPASLSVGFVIAPKGTLPTLALVERCGKNIEITSYNFPGETEANAAFIVTACNAHAELVAALELFVQWVGADDLDAALTAARAALAKVRP